MCSYLKFDLEFPTSLLSMLFHLIHIISLSCRHPEPQSRPSFSDVTAFLSQPESALLMWSEEDRAVHPNAATLGAELQEGHTLYTDLQNTYKPTLQN